LHLAQDSILHQIETSNGGNKLAELMVILLLLSITKTVNIKHFKNKYLMGAKLNFVE